MGLLDEAIREHLELKRRRGADPSEVAREEREALEPVLEQEPQIDDEEFTAPHGDELAEAFGEPALEPHLDGHAPASGEAPHEPLAEAPHAQPHPDIAFAGQETAELDMQAVLDEDADAADAAAPEGPVSAPEPIPGQERLTFE